MDLENTPNISKDLIKQQVFEKLERYQSMPMVLQTLENNHGKVDELSDTLKHIFACEMEVIEHRVNNLDSVEEDEDLRDELVYDNSRIFKDNLKKILRLMVDDIWSKNKKEVAEEYDHDDRFAVGHGAYFYQSQKKGDYAAQEKDRLKRIVRKGKNFVNTNQPIPKNLGKLSQFYLVS